MDPVTDIFTAMRIESVVYRRLELTAPWGLRIERREQACFGTVVRGNCWLTVEGECETAPAHRRRLLLFLYARPRRTPCAIIPGAARTISKK